MINSIIVTVSHKAVNSLYQKIKRNFLMKNRTLIQFGVFSIKCVCSGQPIRAQHLTFNSRSDFGKLRTYYYRPCFINVINVSYFFQRICRHRHFSDVSLIYIIPNFNISSYSVTVTWVNWDFLVYLRCLEGGSVCF